MTKTRPSVALAVVGFLSLSLAACGSKVNQSNYNRIATGMSEAEVLGILGEPTLRQEAGFDLSLGEGTRKPSLATKQFLWQDGDKVITIQMLDGKVATKSATGL